MAEDLGGSGLTDGSASLSTVKRCGLQLPDDLCVARPTHKVAACGSVLEQDIHSVSVSSRSLNSISRQC